MRILLVIFAFLILLFLAELWSIGLVASRIGLIPTIVIVLGTGALGALIAKENAKTAIKDILEGNRSSGLPAKRVVDAVAFLIAAVLLIIPGLVTDAAGLILLLPATRAAIFAHLKRKYEIRSERTNENPAQDPIGSDDVIDIVAEDAES